MQTMNAPNETPELPVLDVMRYALTREPPPKREMTQNYVNQLVTPELESLAASFIQQLGCQQNANKKWHPERPRQSNHLDVTSRFLVFGLKEVKRYIQSRHIQSVLIAKNIQSSSRDHSGLEDQVQAIIDLAAEASVPIVFALTRRTLSRLIFGHDRAAISCIGVMKVDSLGELHQTLLECAWQHRIIWRSQFSQTRTPLLNSRNENPLWIAVYYNYRDPFLLQEILRAGYFLDEPDARNGETPLMLAIQKKRLHWVQDLLPHKPDFSLKSFLGRNVFWHACSSGSESIWGVICEAACQRHPASRVHEWIVQRDVCGTSALDISKAGSLADKVALVTSGLLPHDSTSP